MRCPATYSLRRKGPSPAIAGGRRTQPPHLRQFAFPVRLLQEMPGQDEETVEKPFGGSIRSRQIKLYPVGIQLSYQDRLAVENQQLR